MTELSAGDRGETMRAAKLYAATFKPELSAKRMHISKSLENTIWCREECWTGNLFPRLQKICSISCYGLRLRLVDTFKS
jgi:hypothetical protein